MLWRARVLLGLTVASAASISFAEAARLAAGDVAPVVGDVDNDGQPDPDEPPPGDYAQSAATAVSSLRFMMQKGQDEAKAARDEKDVVRQLCLTDILSTMEGIVRVGEDANRALVENATVNADEARREYRKLKRSLSRMESLLRDARRCAGARSSESTTATELSIDEALLNTDPYFGNPSFFYDPQSEVAEGNDEELGQRDDVTLRPPPASGVS